MSVIPDQESGSFRTGHGKVREVTRNYYFEILVSEFSAEVVVGTSCYYMRRAGCSGDTIVQQMPIITLMVTAVLPSTAIGHVIS